MFFTKYVPNNTFIHKLDARIKFILSFILTSCLFFTKGLVSKLIVLIFIFVCIYFSKISLGFYFKKMKFMLFFFIFSGIMNLFYTKGNIIFKILIISVTDLAVKNLFISIINSVSLMLICVLLLQSVSPSEIIFVSEFFLTPFKFFGVSTNEINLILTLVLRFLPMVFEETEKTIISQKCRGLSFDDNNIFKKLKSFSLIINPIFFSCFKHANEVAIAMECRCYGFTDKRTSLYKSKIQKRDIISIVFILFIIITVIFCEIK